MLLDTLAYTIGLVYTFPDKYRAYRHVIQLNDITYMHYKNAICRCEIVDNNTFGVWRRIYNIALTVGYTYMSSYFLENLLYIRNSDNSIHNIEVD